MMNHGRLGRYINVPHLPNELLYNILFYTAKKRQFYIEDNNSTYGTYKRITNTDECRVNRGDVILIGSEFMMKIIDMSAGSLEYDVDDSGILNRLLCYRSMGVKIVGDYSIESPEVTRSPTTNL
jgi:hypothetical protein